MRLGSAGAGRQRKLPSEVPEEGPEHREKAFFLVTAHAVAGVLDGLPGVWHQG